MGRLPKNWVDCPAHGKPIECFIPFKVPLNSELNRGVPIGSEPFGLRDVVDLQEKFDCFIGMVLDLTNTFRYYDAKQLKRKHHIH